MKRSFLNHDGPIVAAMVESTDLMMCLSHIRTGVFSGADAIAVNYALLDPSCRSEENMKRIIDSTDLPMMIFGYREYQFAGLSDEERADFQRKAASLGATCCDVMADSFDPTPIQFSADPAAAEKQKALIRELHHEGAEVIMSSHLRCFIDTETALSRMTAMADRGADIVKIISYAETPEEFLRSLETSRVLKEKLPVPFVYLCSGKYGPMHRYVSSMLGSAITFTAPVYSELVKGYQPLTKNARMVMDELIRGTRFHP